MIDYGQWRGCNVAFADGALYIERQDKPNLVGGIAHGKVDRIIGKAAFVKLPNGAMGYLDKAKSQKPGDKLLVQVSGYASEDKAWPLSTELKLQGRRYIYLPFGKGIATSKKLSAADAKRLTDELANLNLSGGWIIKSGANQKTGDSFSNPENVLEALALIDKAKWLETFGNDWLVKPLNVLDRAALDARVPDLQELAADDLADRMERLLQLDLPLCSGGRLRLGPTPALFTIDLDMGAATHACKFAEEAATEILRTIRMRAIAGQIVIDPVRASAKELLSYLKLFGQSELPPLTIYGQTKMGLIELSRPRLGPSLYEALDD